MQIKQWEDKYLAHFSYAILNESDKTIILIDPSRNPQQYLDYAEENNAQITGVIETHPHADFVSSHLELHQVTGATIYASRLVGASYPYHSFDEGDVLESGKLKLSATNTPGHSPDSISILLEYDGIQKAVFSGDTLFIGDCGRPDLREGAGSIKLSRHELAKRMYHTLRNKFLPLNDDTLLYPAHGAGTLCGKGLSKADSSTMGKEKQTNWALQAMSEDDFVTRLLSDQPFIPVYFPYDVELNRKGASAFSESVSKVPVSSQAIDGGGTGLPEKNTWIVDARKAADFKNGHLPFSVNLAEDTKFETWLGSILRPGESFYLAGENEDQLKRLISRAASIGYETQVKSAFVLTHASEKQETLNLDEFKSNPGQYNIIDVRNESEVKEGKLFTHSIPIPLAELRNRIDEIPTGKPIVVHCAAGYRSAAGSSILKSLLGDTIPVYDLGEAVKDFK